MYNNRESSKKGVFVVERLLSGWDDFRTFVYIKEERVLDNIQ